MKTSLIVTALYVLFSASLCYAGGSIYRWEDESGTVNYSSRPPHKNAQPADLPPIMRGEVKMGQLKSVTCDKHGGIDCQAGGDSDGSVICADGFKDASARFRFSCNSPKIQLTEISDLRQDGSFSVFVRNSKAVGADKMQVSFKDADGKESPLSGPEQIEAYGMGEYQYRPPGKNKLLEKPKFGQIKVSCANCPL